MIVVTLRQRTCIAYAVQVSRENCFVNKTLAALILAASAMAMLSTEASAYTCVARSANGSYGWGSHPYSLGYARRRALAECAIRTPRNYTCVLTECN